MNEDQGRTLVGHGSGTRADAAAPAEAPRIADDYPELVVVDQAHYVFAGELARGGMGRIRVARDRRLGRELAVKEVLASRDDIARRFEREARITARLAAPRRSSASTRPGSGRAASRSSRCASSSGRSLDEVVAAAATLDDRVALIPTVLAIADAVAYAHDQRVMHRDLKPRNVLVGKFGETVVIDWGLAKDLAAVPEGEVAAASSLPPPPAPVTGTEDTLGSDAPATAAASSSGSASLTLAGSVMGTPAYMPPEQARGEAVDERADVYAIGAILYHVLSGRPPVLASTPAAALDAVIAGAIEPLARREPALPADLLAIVDTAMARDASARYPSARELADDLRRFQTGQLVGAYRYSAGELVRKWLRRHRTVLAIVGAAIAAAAIVGAFAIRGIVVARDDAAEQRDRADVERALAVQSRADAESLVGFMLGDLRTQLEPLGRLDVLDTVTKRATDYYAHQARDDDGAFAADRARALMTRGAVLEARGDLAGGVWFVRSAIDVRQEAVARRPDDLAARSELASAYRKLTDMLRTQHDLPGALDAARQALAITSELAARDRGNVARQRDLAASHTKVAGALRDQGDGSGAVAELRTSLAIREDLARAAPGDASLQRDLAISHDRVGESLQLENDLDGALGELRAGLAIADALAAKAPASPVAARDTSVFQARIGEVELARGDSAAALAAFRAAAEVPARLLAADPDNVELQRDVSVGHANVARALVAAGRRTEALVEYRADFAIAERLARLDPSNAEWQRDLSVSHEEIADVLAANGDAAGALAEVQASLVIMKRLVARDATNTRWGDDLAKTTAKLAALRAVETRPATP